MADDNLEVVREGFATLSESGYEAMLELIAPDFEMHTPPGMAAEPDAYLGPEGVRRWFEEFYEVMDDIRLEPAEFHPVGDWVVVPVTIRARGGSTGLEVDQKVVLAWLVRDGLARRIEFFTELDEAVAAVRARN